MGKTAIAIHGGAGTILRSQMTPEKEKAYLDGLKAALELGDEMLQNGAYAWEAAESAVVELENNPLFNAGKGAVFAGDGTHLLDAAIMRGDTRSAGAVAGIRGVKNPIKLARTIMEKSAYVMMVGAGAEEFARVNQLDFEPPEYFYDQLRYEQWQRVKDTPLTILDHADKGERNFSTVGAVAKDDFGNLAAASSTGGMTNKKYGRVGDTPIIGGGCYADNRSCAVCCSGHGEPFIRAVAAHTLSALIEYKGSTLGEAAHYLIHEKMVEMEGEGALIAVDSLGQIAISFNCKGMYRAAKVSGLPAYYGIYDSKSNPCVIGQNQK